MTPGRQLNPGGGSHHLDGCFDYSFGHLGGEDEIIAWAMHFAT